MASYQRSAGKLARRGGSGLKKAFQNKYVLYGTAAAAGIGGLALVLALSGGSRTLEAVRWNKSPSNPLTIDIRWRVHNRTNAAVEYTAGFANSQGTIYGYVRGLVAPGEVVIFEQLEAIFYAQAIYVGFVGVGPSTATNINQLAQLETREFTVNPPATSGST